MNDNGRPVRIALALIAMACSGWYFGERYWWGAGQGMAEARPAYANAAPLPPNVGANIEHWANWPMQAFGQTNLPITAAHFKTIYVSSTNPPAIRDEQSREYGLVTTWKDDNGWNIYGDWLTNTFRVMVYNDGRVIVPSTNGTRIEDERGRLYRLTDEEAKP